MHQSGLDKVLAKIEHKRKANFSIFIYATPEVDVKLKGLGKWGREWSFGMRQTQIRPECSGRNRP